MNHFNCCLGDAAATISVCGIVGLVEHTVIDLKDVQVRRVIARLQVSFHGHWN